jgi:hypothetical protein
MCVLVPEFTENVLRFSARLDEGALRADSLRLECHPRDRMFVRRPNILWLPVRRLGTKPDYPKGRATRLCRDLYTPTRGGYARFSLT